MKPVPPPEMQAQWFVLEAEGEEFDAEPTFESDEEILRYCERLRAHARNRFQFGKRWAEIIAGHQT